MKKINLKGISEVLSEKELKNVMGGSSGHCLIGCTCPNGKTYQVSCNWSCSGAASTVC
ncbi:MAG: TIGR04149 family rSAM-modified RiPP [Prevotella sp.]|jgi:natural product precursor|nr:TIGR04149 family rSAM-modified RiPP [Prevotella sp.]